MADERTEARKDMAEELEGFAAGPGVVASKSQTQGSIGGLVGFGIVGALLGLIVALIFFDGSGQAILITVVCFAAAGATFGGVAGGFVAPRKKLAGTEADK